MKFLHIALIGSCNRRCGYCRQAFNGHLYPVRHEANKITNAGLLAWLDKYFVSSEWYACITGGEPGLYPEIETLIPALNERGFRGHIETNGSLPIPKSKNFKLLSAWHMGAEFPKHYDAVLVIKNPHEDYMAKIKYCKENGVVYKTIGYGEVWGGNYQMNFKDGHNFENYIFVGTDGIAKKCQQGEHDRNNSIFNLPPLERFGSRKPCVECNTCMENAKTAKFIAAHFA